MQKLMKAMHKEEKGFTLVELMVVVVIIAVLVAIAIPIYQGVQRTAAESAHDANVRTLKGAAAVWFAEWGPTAVGHLPEEDGTTDPVRYYLVELGDPKEPADQATTDPIIYPNEANFGNYIDGAMPEVPGMLYDDVGQIVQYTVTITTDGQITVVPDIGAYEGT